MAQQANPNSMYQSEDLRVQLRSSSILVVSTISGTEFISDIGWFSWKAATSDLPGLGPGGSGDDPFYPSEVALGPDVDQPYGQHQNEDADLGQGE